MSTPARLYLVTPARFDPQALADRAEAALASGHVACLRVAAAAADEPAWRAAVEPLVAPAARHDVALLVDSHYRLARALGLDGVHLDDGAPAVRKAREELGPKRTVGAFAGTSRHQGMILAEAGADYVSFGPVGDTGALGPGERAPDELFEWWAEMIEVPVVAEGGVGVEDAARLSPFADFIVPDLAVWDAPDLVAALESYAGALRPLAR